MSGKISFIFRHYHDIIAVVTNSEAASFLQSGLQTQMD